jgi:hypothetical protein
MTYIDTKMLGNQWQQLNLGLDAFLLKIFLLSHSSKTRIVITWRSDVLPYIHRVYGYSRNLLRRLQQGKWPDKEQQDPR